MKTKKTVKFPKNESKMDWCPSHLSFSYFFLDKRNLNLFYFDRNILYIGNKEHAYTHIQ